MPAKSLVFHDGIHGDVAETMLKVSPDCVKLLDETGELRFMNENGMTLMEIEDFSLIEGQLWWNLWPEEHRSILKEAVEAAGRGMGVTFEAPCPTAQGTPKYWRVKVSAVRGGKHHGKVIAASQDITEEIAKRAVRRTLDA